MKILEWAGVALAVVYAQLLAFNIGAEVAGFALLNLDLSAKRLGLLARGVSSQIKPNKDFFILSIP